MRRFLPLYVLAVLAAVLAAAVLARWGGGLYPGGGAAVLATPAGAAAPVPLLRLLLQMLVVIGAARLCGRGFSRLGQPAVVGEIVAGVLLGPSLLGLLWPQALAALFPAAELAPLQLLSQVGVLLFMFGIGMEVDLSELRRQARAALVISHVSMALPFLLGMALALMAYPLLAPAGVPFHAFALFLGIAMSITAFPVLARILEERRMMHTPVGRMAIACAAIGDVSAWCLLALVVALAHADGPWGAARSAGLGLLFVLALQWGVKPWLRRRFARELAPAAALAWALLLLLACAACTEAIGVHALFGAFLAGTAMPAGAGRRALLRDRLSGFAAAGLLPLFFALTGLRTQVGLLQGFQDWLLCGLIVAAAVAGKLGGTLLAARWTGSGWREAFRLGALMNTRGLIELIVLNLGYDLGILSTRAFTMLVLMALLTTVATGPLLQLARIGQGAAEDAAASRASG
ncbi:MAG TPA: cation:proton antiporter [Nevskia sp.]|nr:cation:proton antiporter [Nevskia sp.]